MQNFRKSILTILRSLLPASAATIFLVTVWHWYKSLTGFYYNGFILLAVVYGVIFLMFLKMYGGTKTSTEKPRNLMLSNGISLLFTNFFIYIIMSLIALGFFNPSALVVSALIQFVACAILDVIIISISRVLFPKAPAIAIITEADIDVINSIKKYDNQHTIKETVPSEAALYEKFADYPVVVIGSIDYAQRGRILTQCYNMGKKVMLIPSMQDILLNNSNQYVAGDKLLYTDKYEGFSAEDAIIKRIFDIIISCLGIIVTSPIMIIVGIIIKLYDGGSVFFRQERLTIGGRKFTIVKFRSMIENAEKSGGTYLVTDSDSRITPIGKFIRATRIDELPQFFNILRGDMSLVGPRPERPELYDIYCETCPEFRYRLKVKAGLTGYAQLYGKYNTPAEDKVKLDLLYIEKASILQDLQLILYTIKIIFVKESTEGITDTSKAAKK